MERFLSNRATAPDPAAGPAGIHVLPLERLDEALVVLRRRLDWSLVDVLCAAAAFPPWIIQGFPSRDSPGTSPRVLFRPLTAMDSKRAPGGASPPALPVDFDGAVAAATALDVALHDGLLREFSRSLAAWNPNRFKIPST